VANTVSACACPPTTTTMSALTGAWFI
jgi:hypothetical protein